ncbi:hypothetical protein CHCC20372_2977 [Bacillus paralicheniformis]|nr:hypothetical protein CHCC20372_2977 [Bacillus paralicheniformis]
MDFLFRSIMERLSDIKWIKYIKKTEEKQFEKFTLHAS